MTALQNKIFTRFGHIIKSLLTILLKLLTNCKAMRPNKKTLFYVYRIDPNKTWFYLSELASSLNAQ